MSLLRQRVPPRTQLVPATSTRSSLAWTTCPDSMANPPVLLRLEPTGLKPVGLAAASLATLVQSDAERHLSLDLHAFVEEQFHRLGHAVKTVLGEHLDDFASHARMSLVGHVLVSLNC